MAVSSPRNDLFTSKDFPCIRPCILRPDSVKIEPQAEVICFLVCPYASSLGLAARQITPAISGAIYRPNSTSYQLQPSFHTSSTEPEPTARARRAGEEFY